MARLDEGWTLAVTPAGACADPAAARTFTDWIPARVPGAAAEALREAGRWRADAPEPLHDKDVWYRVRLTETGRRRLSFEGLATICEAWLDDAPLFTSQSMFQPVAVTAEVGQGSELWLCFRALTPRLKAKGLRARWRPMMIPDQGLRLFRTTLLGHMPGWCPGIDIVGPYRPVESAAAVAPDLSDLRIQAEWNGGATLKIRLPEGLGPADVECGGAAGVIPAGGELVLSVPDAKPWWPHTHGEPALYPLRLKLDGQAIELSPVGFRRLDVDRGADGRAFTLRVNGEAVFCRGACWIAPDLIAPNGDHDGYEPTLRLMVEAGMNMVRVSGVGLYESPAFFEACDALGILVWQDFMFANFDYPVSDPAFIQAVQLEAHSVLRRLQGRPSLAVLCGGSEVKQQAAMMGLPSLDWPLFDEVLPQAAAELRPDVPYVSNTPSGGAMPFQADQGVTHYYGVGAYERPLEDARRAEVKFAAECLAFANVPQPETLAAHLPVPAVHDPRWKAAVPRDRGASWDFEDVRDHYLQRLFGRDPYRLRREDPQLYLDLSRAVSGEVMASVFAEWRRSASPTVGGLVWTLRDNVVGAGWGLIDATGEPKPAWYAIKRVLQAVQVLITDEGVNGLVLHLINDTAEEVAAEIRLSIHGEDGAPLIDVRRAVQLPPRAGHALSAFELIGRFFDVSYAYRFGPRAHEAVCVKLIGEGGVLLSEALHFMSGDAGLGGRGEVEAALDGETLVLRSSRLQRYVHVSDPAFRAADDGFALMPGEPKRVRLIPRGSAKVAPQGEILLCGGHLAGGYG